MSIDWEGLEYQRELERQLRQEEFQVNVETLLQQILEELRKTATIAKKEE